MPQRVLLYPFLLECCQYSSDSFWKHIFEDLAYGKSPYGVYIYKDCLTCNFKGKEFSYKLEKKDPQTLYEEIHDLLNQRVGILSELERSRKRDTFNRLEKENVINKHSWTSIKHKSIRDMLLEKYVIKVKTEHNLTMTHAKKLLSVIFVGLLFKVITHRDIVFEEGEIQDIYGVDIDHLCLDTDRMNLPSRVPLEPTPCGLMLGEWEKYLDTLRKQCIK